MYTDNLYFTEEKIYEIEELCKKHKVFYCQLFGSYPKEYKEKTFSDIDILVMSSDELFDYERMSLDFKNLLGCSYECHITEFKYISMAFRFGSINSNYVLYYALSQDDYICNELYEVLRWGSLCSYNYNILLDDCLEVSDI